LLWPLAKASTSLERAPALCLGEFLEGMDGESAEFEAWLRAERERLNISPCACVLWTETAAERH